MSKRHQKANLIKTLAHYGVHIWAILIIANAALVYAFHFSTQAANEKNNALTETTAPADNASIDEQPTEEPTQTTKRVKPVGTLISLVFTIPGIGSGSGNMTPKRLERNVTFYLFSPDANSLNKSVKPLYTLKTTAKYDTNTVSPTYTSFRVDAFDFGGDVKSGKYQIAFRTDESLRTLLKENPENVGGQLFDFREAAKIQKLPAQTVLMGDTLPKEGDNTVDVGDYNAFVNCFGERNNDDFCTGSNYGDFDDNGVIDGVDYNLLLRSFSALLAQGQSIPKITTAPTGPARVTRLSNLTTPTEAKKEPSPAKESEEKPAERASKSGGNVLGGILFFIFILISGAAVFILFKKNEKFRTTVKSILHMSPTGMPPADPNAPAGEPATLTDYSSSAPDTTPPSDSAQTPAPPTEQQPIQDATPQAADPNAIAASTEIPVQTPPAAPDPSTIAASTEIPVNQTTSSTAGETIEKDCYVKKVGPDEAGTGAWIRLTDDNGALEAHYAKLDIEDGFAKVKGVMKTENGKTFLEVSELTPAG